MEMVQCVCQSCGATLKKGIYDNQIRCGYCGSVWMFMPKEEREDGSTLRAKENKCNPDDAGKLADRISTYRKQLIEIASLEKQKDELLYGLYARKKEEISISSIITATISVLVGEGNFGCPVSAGIGLILCALFLVGVILSIIYKNLFLILVFCFFAVLFAWGISVCSQLSDRQRKTMWMPSQKKKEEELQLLENEIAEKEKLFYRRMILKRYRSSDKLLELEGILRANLADSLENAYKVYDKKHPKDS